MCNDIVHHDGVRVFQPRLCSVVICCCIVPACPAQQAFDILDRDLSRSPRTRSFEFYATQRRNEPLENTIGSIAFAPGTVCCPCGICVDRSASDCPKLRASNLMFRFEAAIGRCTILGGTSSPATPFCNHRCSVSIAFTEWRPCRCLLCVRMVVPTGAECGRGVWQAWAAESVEPSPLPAQCC